MPIRSRGNRRRYRCFGSPLLVDGFRAVWPWASHHLPPGGITHIAIEHPWKALAPKLARSGETTVQLDTP